MKKTWKPKEYMVVLRTIEEIAEQALAEYDLDMNANQMIDAALIHFKMNPEIVSDETREVIHDTMIDISKKRS